MGDRKEYIDKMAIKLKEWDDEILKLQDKATNSTDKIKVEIEDHIKDLQSHKEVANQKFNDLNGVGKETWEDLKAGAELTFDALGDSVKKVRNILK